MEVQYPVSCSIINSVPGLGFILSLIILYEIDDIHRFSNVGGQRWRDKLVQRYGKAKVRFAIEFCALFYK